MTVIALIAPAALNDLGINYANGKNFDPLVEYNDMGKEYIRRAGSGRYMIELDKNISENGRKKILESIGIESIKNIKTSGSEESIAVSQQRISYKTLQSKTTCKFTQIKAIQPDNPPGVIKLNELDKYMKVDKNHNVHFNYQAAIRDGVPPVKVYFGLHAAAAINKMVRELRDNGKISDDTSKEIDSPHPCPPRGNSGVYRNTKDEIKNYLLSHGFHVVPGYATYSYGDDFAKVVSAYGCDWGPFRHEAWPVQSGSRWTYKYQTPEPNPEILSYTWPAWWWGAYVNWWHRSYC